MKLHTQSFFCNREKGPICHIDTNIHPYPITITINRDLTDRYTAPYTSIYLTSFEDLVTFKNSVIGSFEKAMRKVKDVK